MWESSLFSKQTNASIQVENLILESLLLKLGHQYNAVFSLLFSQLTDTFNLDDICGSKGLQSRLEFPCVLLWTALNSYSYNIKRMIVHSQSNWWTILANMWRKQTEMKEIVMNSFSVGGGCSPLLPAFPYDNWHTLLTHNSGLTARRLWVLGDWPLFFQVLLWPCPCPSLSVSSLDEGLD